MDKNYAKYLLEKTRQNYNLIAKDFSRTRQTVWQELNFLSDYIKEGEKVLDLGCGNGRLAEMFHEKRIEYYGVDNSEELIKIANTKHKIPNTKYKFQAADALNLPFPDNFFDKVLSIAVLHHIPSEEFRLQFLRESQRVLKPEGELILTVWNLWQKKTTWKLFLKNALLKLIGKSKLDFKDIFYPWKKPDGRVFAQRYFHLFDKAELKKLTERTGFYVKEIKRLKIGRESNFLLIAEK
ncbi:MAG: methyltransferase domain-containing protein [bacterium]